MTAPTNDTTAPGSNPGEPAARYTGEAAQRIELHWQQWWEDNGTFNTPNPAGSLADPAALAGRPKLYVLDMFPYPSGAGLHVGHPLGFIGTDVYSRFKRMTGHNVMYTMGFDAFGLPAEQYAVQTGQHPAITTERNIATYRRQLRRLGLSHDQRRSVSTADPSYYRWTQWIFLQVFNSWYDAGQGKARPITELAEEFASGARRVDGGLEWTALTDIERSRIIDSHRLAYISDAPVNWCPGLGTVVANEEVTSDGRSDRGNFPVFKRNMRQWKMRITDYADRLLDDLDLLDWSEAIKSMQRNWIGRSTGATVRFATAAGSVSVFTTRPDTLFGATFLVLAPEHPLVEQLTAPANHDAVRAYCTEAAGKTDIDRQSEGRAKTGVFTGSNATNPATGEEIPVWVADYVLMGYGTGAIMAVPCGDQRDFEFARKFGLAVPAIQMPPEQWFKERSVEPQTTVAQLDTSVWPEAFTHDAPYVNCKHNGLELDDVTNVVHAKQLAIEWLIDTDQGEATTTYKLRDWLFSRQRYWGEPFPIVYDENNQPHAIPEDQLPLVLPDTDSFSPRTFAADDEFSDPES
ncbi:MAG: class I tRNA ligase family protein, partial [Ilumatobacteraceae bacterium]